MESCETVRQERPFFKLGTASPLEVWLGGVPVHRSGEDGEVRATFWIHNPRRAHSLLPLVALLAETVSADHKYRPSLSTFEAVGEVVAAM